MASATPFRARRASRAMQGCQTRYAGTPLTASFGKDYLGSNPAMRDIRKGNSTMSHATNPTWRQPGILSVVAHAIGDFFVMISESNFRVREAEKLNAMTDAQLCALGLRREDIPRFVFRDLRYV
ncbi:hypothetical protein KUH32_04485 [Thalassococcus sp. CAU 1522]|uniref:DUF1127 domain-containing protein n=1 Tax=Thalassococcus arenae TaxID=2851652 RepID=A0ABS6N5G2_9RHOB|nr:hypothetical protein [Thalassococcus arenae]MBV2359023.1 hypothetical protein [Thalassococcus arenae]